MRTTQLFGGLAAALATAAAVHGQTATLYVDDDALPGGSGLNWDAPLRDLQDALSIARSIRGVETVIKVAQGVYTPDRGTGDRASSFVVSSGLTLMGGFAGFGAANPDERDSVRFVSVLSGDLAHNDGPAFTRREDNCYHVVTAQTASIATLSGVTIRGGHANGLAEMSDDRGAAAWGGDWLRLSQCLIIDNFAQSSGSVAWSEFQSVTIDSCRIVGNRVGGHASDGVAIAGWQINVLASVFLNNISPGAMNYARGGCWLESCLFAGNQSTGASLLSNVYGGTLNIRNCTISDNHTRRGVLTLSGDSQTVIANSILANNTSDEIGPALLDGSQPYTSVSIENCIVPNALVALSTHGDVELLLSNVLDTNPLFNNRAGADNDPSNALDNDYSLRTGSPAIDATATAEAPFSVDASGGTRAYDDPGTPNALQGSMFGSVDLGALEFHGTSCRADWNGSGQVRADDVPGFVDSWLAGDPRADYNRVDGVTLQDLFDFLTGYFTGCP